ncbi:MAG: GNAT family N-acetyltransferase [Candidatus Brocadiaceae bacterium]|nr:GNAT family N-acetyltransferase [Candidatus Brocadiaceae bacterium]
MRHRDDYEICLFHSTHIDEIVDVLEYLWGNDKKGNLKHFDWKYIQNPYRKKPLGVVTLYKGKVVAFRGYFATKWKTGARGNEILFLIPGDTVVHATHRKKGLSVAMGKFAMKEYEQHYRLFLNFTAWKNSAPGYLRMGYKPLAEKAYMIRYKPFGLIKSILAKKHIGRSGRGKITFGTFDTITVSDTPKPNEMSNIVSATENEDNKLQLVRDAEFYQWRFNSNKNRYVFYYDLGENEELQGYVVLGIDEEKWWGGLLDFGETDGHSITKILTHIIKNEKINALTIYNFSPTTEQLKIFEKTGFKRNTLERLVKKNILGEWPLYLRPIKALPQENDWNLNGLDITKIENWNIKEICSDAV